MKLGIVIVLFNTPKKEVARLKKEIKKLEIKNKRIYFIDNSKTGKGFAAGVNNGLRKAIKAGCDVFLIANPDISFKSLSNNNMWKAAHYFDIWGYAMKQGKTLYYGGELDRWRMSSYFNTKKPKSRFIKCTYVTGSLMLFKKKVIDKIGFFEESYGMYYEDVDYCLRAKQAGFTLGIDAKLVYTHFEWSSGNPKKDNYLLKNRIKILFKHGTLLQKAYEVIRIPKTIIERSPFLINFFSFNMSSLVIKSLNFILFLFLIRTFSAADYGVYILVWAYIGLFNPLADLGTTSYGIVYLANKEKKYLNQLFSLRFALAAAVFATTLILAPIVGYRGKILLFILLTSPIVFANMASGSLLIIYSLKEKLYKISLISVCFNVLLITLLVCTLILHGNLTTVFSTIGILYLLYFVTNLYFLAKEKIVLKFVVNRKIWTEIVRRSSVFVFISFFAGLYFMGDIFLLNMLKGSKDVGIYSAGYKFFEAFIFIVSGYNFTATPNLARLHEQNRSQFLLKIKKDIIFLALGGLLIALCVAVLSPHILPFILQGNYKASIHVAQIVIFGLPLMLVSSVFLNSLYVIKQARWVLGLFMAQFVINVLLNLIFIPHYSYIASSYITVFSEILNLMGVFMLFKWFTKKTFPS